MTVTGSVVLREFIDSAGFRALMARVPTSVAVVAGIEHDKPVGLTVGTFASVSLDPPLISICVGLSSRSWPRIEPAGRFAISVLAADQTAVSNAFASRDQDKFRRVDWSTSPHGMPWIDGSVAHFDCAIEQVVEAGDHLVVLGRVLALGPGREREPMVFHDRRLGGVRHER